MGGGSSREFDRLLAAYREAACTTSSLEEFFHRLALITGEQGRDYDTLIPNYVWYNRPGYYSRIYLVYLFFSKIALYNLDLIKSWHSRNNLTELHLKDKTTLDVFISNPLGYAKETINSAVVQSIHPNYSTDDWNRLLTIVEAVANTHGLDT
jgi:hypothetical protein